MTASAPRLTPQMTVGEFLEMEEASSVKHEYLAGQIYALAGSSARHNRIVMNIAAQLWNAAGDGPCQVYGSDMRLRVGDEAVYYPDVQVVCDPSDTEEQFKTRPCLIVEVLSPSTESIDVREKMLLYRQIGSLQEYLVIWRDEMRVHRHYRVGDNWHDALHREGSTVPIACPEGELTVAQIYRGLAPVSR